MVQLNSSSQHESDTSALSIILLSASMLSFVITFLGIKLKWFRHRLTFDQNEAQTEGTPVLLKTTSITEFRENCARGVYRRAEDAESLMATENLTAPKSNGQAKTKSSDRHSIFRLPFKNKFNLTKFPSTEESLPSTNAQSTSLSPVFPPNRDQEVATLQKNEHLRRMIHEKLKSRTSASMPDLARVKPSVVVDHNEHPVDTSEPSEIKVKIESKEAAKNNDQTNQDLSRDPSAEVVFEHVLKNKVVFEEINEIEDTIYEAQFENEIGESSTDHSMHQISSRSPSTLIVDEPIKETTKQNGYASQVDQIDSIEYVIEDDQSASVSAPPVFEKVRFDKTENFIEEKQPDVIVPPTPMKRKSREGSFSKKRADVQAPPVENVDFDAEIVRSEIAFKKEKEQAQEVESHPRYSEIEEVPVEIEPPVVKPRIKQNIERTLDVSKDESKDEKFAPVETVSKAEQEVTLSAALNSFENLQKLKEKFADSSSSSSMEDESDIETMQHIEVKVVPKSILKTSETSGMQKSITFQNTPHSIRYHETSSSESEDEDIWSRVNQHRHNLTRNNDDRREAPPPLPKTPPPTAEEEKQFSFA